MNKKKCLECGDSFKGRIDKKYCSDYCRNTYNNKVNRDSKNLIRNTNNRLRKNYNVLTKLNKTGKVKIYVIKASKTYFYVYQGYLELENEIYLLIKRA